MKSTKAFLVFLASAFALAAASASAQSPHTHQHSFGDARKWSQIFDDPKRDAWQKPHEVIQALALRPDAVIADVGAGTGYFSARLANMVPQGRVYAVDTEPDMVRYVAERAKREGLKNLMAVAAKPDDAKLPQKADLVLLVDVYHHIEDRQRYFRKLADSIKQDGRLAIIDFRMDSPDGPPKSARIAPERVKAELKSAGYELAQEHSFLPNQYFLVFQRGRSGRGAGMMHGMRHGMAAGGHGAMGGPVAMLTRQDAGSSADMAVVHDLLMNHDKIRRTVTKLPDGIRTVTESDDPRVAQAIKVHVASMSQRLEDGREFNLFSDTLPVLFANGDKLRSTVTTTEQGSVVTRTAADPRVVAALQAHAAEVSELAHEGMLAMRRGMMRRMMAGDAR